MMKLTLPWSAWPGGEKNCVSAALMAAITSWCHEPMTAITSWCMRPLHLTGPCCSWQLIQANAKSQFMTAITSWCMRPLQVHVVYNVSILWPLQVHVVYMLSAFVGTEKIIADSCCNGTHLCCYSFIELLKRHCSFHTINATNSSGWKRSQPIPKTSFWNS